MSAATADILDLTDEQREIRALCREFAERDIRPASRNVDEADTEMPWDVWRKAAEIGITTYMLPEEYGGGGTLDLLTQCLVLTKPDTIE